MTDRCHLLVELTPQSFRLAVVEKDARQCMWLEEYQWAQAPNETKALEDLQAIVSGHAFLGKGFWQSVRATVMNQSFTLIPTPLFRREYAARYLYLARGSQISAQEEVHYYEHTQLGAVNVFSVERSVMDWLLDLYPFQEITLTHQTSALIENARRESVPHLYIEKEAFTLVYAPNGQLKYCNRFQGKNVSDLVYFVLFALNEVGLDPSEARLLLYGQVEWDSELTLELGKYIPHLELGQTITTLTVPDGATYRYASLLGTVAV